MENKIIIIIDGIDVSKCEFAEIFDGKCLCNCVMDAGCERTPKKVISIYCNENQFCDFKELARAKEENENLKALQRKTVQLTKEEYDRLIAKSLECEELQKTLSKTEVAKVLIQSAEINYPIIEKYNKALQEIKKVAKQGLNPVCYKINCSRCKCYLGGDFSNAGVTNFINQFFDDNGDLVDEGNFVEELENLIETERKACNRAKPISEKILEIIESIDAESEQ